MKISLNNKNIEDSKAKGSGTIENPYIFIYLHITFLINEQKFKLKILI